MVWTIHYTESALKELRKLDRRQAERILDFMDTRIAPLDDPRTRGKALTGPLGDLWRFRVGDCRIICDILDAELIVLVIKVGKRGNVYRQRRRPGRP